MGDLSTPNPQDSTKRDPVWTDAAFFQFLAIFASSATQVAGTQNRIDLPSEALSKGNWYVAGVRFDPGAPGLSDDIRAQFGQSPEIRLIVQLVTQNADGTPKINDLAGHLIFDFVTGVAPPAQTGCFQRPTPDLSTFRTIIGDLAALRSKLGGGQLGPSKIPTSGIPLGIHPGLADGASAVNVRTEMKALLERYISSPRLDAMAVAGIPPAGAPWIFLSMTKVQPNGPFVPVPGPTLDGQQLAQMLAPVGSTPPVLPVPSTNNLNIITCKNAAAGPGILPVTARNGLSTAGLFTGLAPAASTTTQILNLIADPSKSHFFNTDCVSCHTETRRSMSLQQVTQIPGIDPSVLPRTDWIVRNFGWSPPTEGPVQGVATRRTAAETATVVAFVNSQLLNP
jgi:hypothetical protein